MFDSDPPEFADTDLEERMPKFLKSSRATPPAALVMREPRLRKRGFRWAPSSFLHQRDKCYDTQRLTFATEF